MDFACKSSLSYLLVIIQAIAVNKDIDYGIYKNEESGDLMLVAEKRLSEAQKYLKLERVATIKGTLITVLV